MKKIVLGVVLNGLMMVAWSMSNTDTSITQICGCKLDTIFLKNIPNDMNNIGYYRSNKTATIDQVLSQIQQVNLIKRGAYGLEPSIRAFKPEQTVLLLDGMKIHGACTDKMDPSSIYIEPQNLKAIQVNTANNMSKGASIAGSIDLQLKQPILWDSMMLHFQGNVQTSYQTNANAWFASAFMQWSSKKWALLGNFTYRKAGNYKSSGGKIIPFSQYEKINYNVSGLYAINEKWNFKIDYIGDQGWNIGYPALTMDVGYANANIVAVSLLQNKNLSNTLRNLIVKTYINQIQHSMDDTKRPNVPIHMDMPGISKTAGAFAEGDILIHPKHTLSFRGDFSINQLNAWMIMYPKNSAVMYMPTLPKNNTIQGGLSIQYAWKFLPQHSIIFKERIDVIANQLIAEDGKRLLAIFYPSIINHSNRLFLPTQTGVTYQYQPNREWILSISGNMNQRTPSPNELFGYFLYNRFDNYDYIGNPNLKNETAFQGELQAMWSNNQFNIQLNIFSSYVSNYIFGNILTGVDRMTVGASGVKSYIQLPYALLAGGELALTYLPINMLELNTSFKYNYGQDNKNRPLPLIPPLQNQTRIKFFYKSFSASAEMQAALAQRRISILSGEKATNGYAVFNLRTNYEFEFQKRYKLNLLAAVENIFDVWYREHLDWGGIPRPGRNFIFQILFNW